MKKLSLFIALFGILTLIHILLLSPPITLNSPSDLSNLPDNTKVQAEGRVIKQTSYTIFLDNNLSLSCPNCPSYQNSTIKSIGIIDSYQNKTQIKILRIIK